MRYGGTSMKKCSVENCGKPVHARGWCQMHYLRNKRSFLPKRARRPKAQCSITNCTALAYAKGWCVKHYSRFRKHGTPFAPKHGFIPCNRRAAKLTEANVRKIRKLRAEGVQGKDPAARYGVSPATICMAVKGRTWGDLKTTYVLTSMASPGPQRSSLRRGLAGPGLSGVAENSNRPS